jgi:hypothetical protein
MRHCGLCWSYKVQEGTALDVAGNGRYARKVVVACKRERARWLHTVAPADLAELAKSDPSASAQCACDGPVLIWPPVLGSMRRWT